MYEPYEEQWVLYTMIGVQINTTYWVSIEARGEEETTPEAIERAENCRVGFRHTLCLN
jgi:hypothetical protein